MTMQNIEATTLADVEAALADLDLDNLEEIVAAGETAPEVTEIAEIEELDALADLDEEEVEAVEDEEPVAVSDVLDDEFLQDLDLTVARQTAYDEQEATPMPDIAETKAAAATGSAPIKTKPARNVSKGTSTPRAARELAAVPAEFFDLNGDIEDAAALDANKAAVIAKRPGQVKIAEKFDNLFLQLSSAKLPSVYVMKAFDLLESKGSFTSTELVGHFKASGLGEGTARSQTGQIMVLFDVTGIAKRAGQKLDANAQSSLAKRIRALRAAAPTAA